MKAKQYAWVHLITNGKMNQRPSYYGGWDPIDKRIHSFSFKEEKNMKENFLADIKKYGVNWDKTDDVQSELYSEFDGTFCDSSSKTYLEGWISLRNGKKNSGVLRTLMQVISLSRWRRCLSSNRNIEKFSVNKKEK